MKIVILNGSPRPRGSSSRLLAAFTDGAQAASHSLTRFDLDRMNIHPCRACYYCEDHDGVCIRRDDMAKVLKSILDAELLVFATPMYYFGMSAQLKTAIDRFFAADGKLRAKRMKSVLIAPAADTDPAVSRGLLAHYEQICQYLRLQDQGRLLALGINEPEDLDGTAFLDAARALGAGLV